MAVLTVGHLIRSAALDTRIECRATMAATAQAVGEVPYADVGAIPPAEAYAVPPDSVPAYAVAPEGTYAEGAYAPPVEGVATFGVTQTCIDAHSIANSSHTALQQVAGSQLAADFTKVAGFVRIEKRRIASDHQQAGKFRKTGDEILCDAG